MGKNKLKTYALSVVVVTIWGVIGYQIYSALNPSEEELGVPQVPLSFNTETVTERDTFSIQNNYRDPFLGKLPDNKQPVRTVQTQRPAKTEDTVVFPNIKYKGMVQNAEGGETVFAISINGIESILGAGQSYQDVQLISGKPQEILISFKGKRKTLRK
ncbi:hypothetical protein DSM03_11722 [Leeuwenhoekiella aestuarii]|uniref:hypothetical protein n=1 Tax=Leeuwenhoekiella aestuarii TaxID=2249426 RepID=UPI000FFEFC94|nr:hypothetical protein [Leeuwenhoekiella aestuarii]RXG11385.1 hypothetical protein DSM03_11722 [Leeuwenhoekiella aestuarii]